MSGAAVSLLVHLQLLIAHSIYGALTTPGPRAGVSNPAVVGVDEGEAEGSRTRPQSSETKKRGVNQVRIHPLVRNS